MWEPANDENEEQEEHTEGEVSLSSVVCPSSLSSSSGLKETARTYKVSAVLTCSIRTEE
jgi:hypothetical protein